MKKLAPTIMILLAATSCGKKKEEVFCKSRHQKIMECLREGRSRGHHPQYSRLICGQRFENDKCYK